MALKDKYLTISQAAQKVGVTRQTVSRWIKEGGLPAEKIGREVVIKTNDFFRFYFNRIAESFGNALSMMVEVWLRIEFFEDYSDKDKFQLTDISSDGVFEFSVIRKDGAKDILKVKTSIGLTKNGKRPLPYLNMGKVWKEVDEGRAT